MIRKKYKEREWLEFEIFQQFPSIAHGIFTRKGGVSEAPYNSLNVGHKIGDDSKNVDDNIMRIQEALSIPTIVYAEQIHGSDIVIINKFSHEQPSCDALITDEHSIGIMIKHADCQAALFYDAVNEVIACAHAGWRGSVQNIYSTVLHTLEYNYGSAMENIFVGISPSLGPCHAEFTNYREELPTGFLPFSNEQSFFDFWNISRKQLTECGILDTHIEVAEICTYDAPDDFFSYRRDGKRTGRNGTVIAKR